MPGPPQSAAVLARSVQLCSAIEYVHPKLPARLGRLAVAALLGATSACAEQEEPRFEVGFVWRGARLAGQGDNLGEAVTAACRTYCRKRDPLFAACVRECHKEAVAAMPEPE